MLAVRDEFVGRDFDDPGAWWPDQPRAIGGRDRVAGGTWCACDADTGAVAVVLNRPERRVAAPGAASRGVLPLLALRHGTAWPQHLDVTAMASFNLMLAGPDALWWWTFDGSVLTGVELDAGTYLAKPTGLADGQLSADLADLADPTRWKQVLADSRPRPDPSGLLVRIEHADRVYGTVFAQLIRSAAGDVVIEHTRTPQRPDTFVTARWTGQLR